MAPTKKPAATASKPLAPAKSAKKPQPPLRKPICVERRPNPLKLSPTRRMNDLPKPKKKPAAAPVASLRAPSNPAVPLLRTPSKKPAAAAAAASSSSKKPAAAPLKLKAAKAPLKLLKATKKKSQAKERCPICLEAFPTAAMRALRSAGVVTIGACAHSYCRPCLAQYCKTALADNKALETGGALPCPVPRCAAATNGRGGELGPWEVKALVSEEEWARHKERAEAHQIEMSTRTRFCPRAKCGAVNRVPIDATGPSTCVGCKKPFCAGAGCGLLPHAGKTCEQAAETLYGRWGKKHKVKACPTCHRHIEKNGGCNHMKCVVCKTDWDWACGKPYTGANRCTCHSNFYYPPAYNNVALPAPVGAAMF